MATAAAMGPADSTGTAVPANDCTAATEIVGLREAAEIQRLFRILQEMLEPWILFRHMLDIARSLC